MFVSGPGAWGVDEVDLAGAYVLPAFAEAHHHRICDESVGRFLAAGIVYVGVMNARVSSRECQRQMYGPGGVEIVNALAGLTAHDAHPSQIGLYFLPADAIDGEWVHYVDSPADLDRVWARIEASPPDILKIFLGYSEDYERLRDDPSIAPWYRGLDPALAPEIVARAHARNLRVAVHVLSAHDFDIAVSAGADIVAHMPGFAPGPAFTPETPHPWLLSLLDQPERYLITRAAARAAARRGVAVITTLSGIEELPTPLPPGAAEYAALQRRVTGANVLMLRDAGVTLLIGSDRYDYSSVDEAQYLVRERLLSARQALRSLTYDTPRILFPQRNIGVLRAGGEASFVVLARNPLRDLAAIAHPTAVYKRGARVAAPQSAPQAER
jgi:imidazolonepropionase-like amidohydrolase